MEKKFVVDNSIIMSWCFRDESNKYADTILNSLEEYEALVPSIWPLEVVNVLLVSERRSRLTEADSVRFLTLIDELPISVQQETPDRMLKEILALARKCYISSYDASYLDLAMRHGVPIATQDSGLKKAANKCKVSLFRGIHKK